MILRCAAVFGFILALGVMVSCRPESIPLSPDLPATPILTAETQWGVVNRPYLKVLQTSDAASSVMGLLRKGDIVEVLSKTGAGDGRSYWLELIAPETSISGWTPDSSLDVYDSKAQARTASAAMMAEN